MAQTAKPYQCAQSHPPTPMRFCPLVASAIGVSEAIVLHRLDYWLGRSKHRFKGRAWVYNTYEAWQEQFPFWSRRTIQSTFRRLERIGVVESTQAHNRSRWDKTKWYSIDYAKLAELVPETVVEAPANDRPVEATSMDRQASTDEAVSVAIDGEDVASSWKTKRSSINYSTEILNRACEGEPGEEARQPALETTKPLVPECHHGEESESIEAAEVVNELDAAYEAIPEGEREIWCERANWALEEAGMPEWMRITGVVKEMALRLWMDQTIPELVSG